MDWEKATELHFHIPVPHQHLILTAKQLFTMLNENPHIWAAARKAAKQYDLSPMGATISPRTLAKIKENQREIEELRAQLRAVITQRPPEVVEVRRETLTGFDLKLQDTWYRLLTRELREMLDNNPHIKEQALERMKGWNDYERERGVRKD